jgi:hypothetical protein
MNFLNILSYELSESRLLVMCPIICTTTQQGLLVLLTVSVWHGHGAGYPIYSELFFKNAGIMFCFIENLQYKIILPFPAGVRKVSCLNFLYIQTWHSIHSHNWKGLSRHYSFVCAQNTQLLLFLVCWIFIIFFTSAIVSFVRVLLIDFLSLSYPFSLHLISLTFNKRSGDRIPVWARFFAHVKTGPGAHPASFTVDTGSVPGVKRPGCGADHPPPPSTEVENE